MSKVFEIAKQANRDSKEVLAGLRALGIEVKTPVSVIPEEHLEKALVMFPKAEPAKPKVVDYIPPVVEKVEAKADTDILRKRDFVYAQAEGLEPRFNQFAVGIIRKKENGKNKYSVLTIAIDADTLELKLLSENVKRTEAEAILDMKMTMSKRKIV